MKDSRVPEADSKTAATETLPRQEQSGTPFGVLTRTMREEGPGPTLEALVRRLEDAKDYRALLDALLLKARHELGMPLIQVGQFSDLPESSRGLFEDRYVEAVRLVGSRFLAAEDIPTAWVYYRAIAEPEAVAQALDSLAPPDDPDRLNQIIDVAFNQGANPRRGFELILAHFGTCSAISAFEQIPHGDETTRVACVEALVRKLHENLASNIRHDIERRNQPAPAAGVSIASMIEGREWLFADESYHIDVSHLSAVVRFATILTSPDILELAIDLAEYGRRLSPRLRFEGVPPFENTFEDHVVYLKALVGRDPDAAIKHFREKLDRPGDDELNSEGDGASLTAQVLINLLARCGRYDEAIDLASTRLAGLPDTTLTCPGIAELCQRAGKIDRLAEIARRQGNLVYFTAALLALEKPDGDADRPIGTGSESVAG